MGQLGYPSHIIFSSEIVMHSVIQKLCVFEKVQSRVKFVGDMEQLSAFCQSPAVQILVCIKEPFDKVLSSCILCGCQKGIHIVIVPDSLIEGMDGFFHGDVDRVLCRVKNFIQN